MKTAWLFPGQGAQQPGMGRDLAARSPRAAALLAHAGRAAGGVDVLRVLSRGEPAMDRSSFLQPVLTAIALGVAGELEAAGLRPEIVAGHSLGEVAAWSAAGCLSAEDAVAAAGLRGRLMERAAEAHPGGMLAIVAGSDTAAHEALACGRAHGEIVLAARNSVDQWVLSGDEAALRRVAAAFPATRLPVQGPWHSPAMASAAEEWLFALLAIPRTRGHAGFVANRDGRLVTDEERIPHLLAGQLTQAVAWYETMITLGEAGVTHAVIMGPGRALRGLLRRHFGERLRVLLTEDESDISSTIEVLRS